MTATANQTLCHAREGNQLISVEQCGALRSLHFHNDIIQTQININDPTVLPLTGNRQMLSFLMFNMKPESILLAGCGGGSLARWFHHHLPNTKGQVIEISPTVISLAKRYFDFPADAGSWKLINGDIRGFIDESRNHYDFLLFDLDENGLTPEWLTEPGFLEKCRQRLSAQGVITFNLIAHAIEKPAENIARQIWFIRQAFPDLTYCHSSSDNSNIFVTAFQQRPDTEQLQEKARNAESKYHIEFELFYQQLKKDNPPNSGIF